MKRKAIESCTPPVHVPAGDTPWRCRQDIIRWLEDLRVSEAYVKQSFAAKLGSEHTVLLSEVVDHVLLLAVDPASQDKQ
jgi:hypothetical protein